MAHHQTFQQAVTAPLSGFKPIIVSAHRYHVRFSLEVYS